MGSYLIGIGGLVFLMVLWAVIQAFWRKTFSDHLVDEDVLAGRTDCGSCGCMTACKNKLKPLSTE